MYYALTIRKSTLQRTLKQAKQVIKDLKYFIKSLKERRSDLHIECHLEAVEHDGPKWNIHLHAMIESSQKLLKREIRICKGYFVNFQTVRSVIAWNVYISKGQDDERKILDRVSRAASKGPSLPGYGAARPISNESSDLEEEQLKHESYKRRISRINLFKMA